MSEYSQSRLESRIIEAINTMIVRQEIKNPLLGKFVTITRVTLSKDNAYASVYVSALDQLQRSVEALQRSAGYIQGRLGALLKTKNTPRLTFIPDTSEKEAQELNDLIDKLNSKV